MVDGGGNLNGSGERIELLKKLLDLRPSFEVPRQQFQQFYDTWLEDAELVDAPASFMHAVIKVSAEAKRANITVNPAVARDAVAMALAAFGNGYLSANCFSAAMASGVFGFDTKPVVRQSGLMGKFLSRINSGSTTEPDLPAAGRLQSSNLHAVTAPEQIWTDPGYLLPALLLARRRLCKIITLDNEFKPMTGTGFLIGPSTIITNNHVVVHRNNVLSDREEIKILFDYSPTTGLQNEVGSKYYPQLDWCIARSETGPTNPPGGNRFWWTNMDIQSNWLGSVENNLDYAIIQLDASPGLQRGWYDISEFGEIASLDGCWVLHHPGGSNQTVTEGNLHYVRPGNPARLFHSASTVHGSSGGLMLNTAGNPVGLHYMGLGVNVFEPGAEIARVPDTVINVAIPLRRIAEDLESKNVLKQISETKGIIPNRGCLDGRRPVFGRQGFINDLQDLYKGKKPLMMVSVAQSVTTSEISQPGKSFSADMVKSLFPQPGNIHIEFKAGDLKADGRKMAAMILEAFAPDLLALLPDDPDTTTPAFIKRIVSYVRQSLRERTGNKIVWLIIDDLEKHEVSDASGREFLNTLYDRVNKMPNLRIILIGLEEDTVPSGINRDLLINSLITKDDIFDRKKLFNNWLDQRGGKDTGVGAVGQNLLASSVVSYAGDEAPLAQMAKFVSEHLSDVTNTVFGEIDPEEEAR